MLFSEGINLNAIGKLHAYYTGMFGYVKLSRKRKSKKKKSIWLQSDALKARDKSQRQLKKDKVIIQQYLAMSNYIVK